MVFASLAHCGASRDNGCMKQADLGLDLTHRKTRKAVFLDEMDRVVPWAQLLALIEPHAPRKDRGRPPFGIEVMLRIHYLQNWFGLSDVAMEEALFDVPLYRQKSPIFRAINDVLDAPAPAPAPLEARRGPSARQVAA